MTIDPSRLKIDVEEQARWRRRLSVIVPSDVIRAEEQKAARNVASRMKMRGFRKGRVPAKVVESRFGGALRKEALDRIINDAYRHALQARDLRPISEGELEEVHYTPDSDEDLRFAIAFDVRPEIQIGRLGGFALERPVATVTDEQVEEALTHLRRQNGAWAPVEEGTPEDGDLVSVHIARFEDGETDQGRDYEFVLGQGDAIPSIEEAIQTLEPGASGRFTVSFPDDFPDEDRRGRKEQVDITLHSRKALQLPELDDEFARQVGPFDDLAALRARVREDLEREARDRSESEVRGRLLDQLIEANPFEVPRSMVDGYVDSLIGDRAEMTPERREELRTGLRPEAERAVKRYLVVDRVAESQGLTATEDEVDARVEEIAEKNETDAAKVYASLQKSGRIEALEREITERKVFDFLEDQSEIIEAPAG